MRQRFRRNEDWCPECGHLLPKNSWNCNYCGWTIGDVESYSSGMDSIDDYSNISIIADVDRGIESLIDSD
nr:hypothetical protein [uncultured Desulfobacter sp.]